MTKLTEERIKELATAQRGPRGELIWPDFPINFARAIEAVLQPVQEPVAWVRRHPDGALTAEFLEHAVIEPVRMKSGAWVPLYTAPPDQTAEIERLRGEVHLLTDQIVAQSHYNMAFSSADKNRITTLEAALRKTESLFKALRPTTDNFDHCTAINRLLDELNKALGEE